MPFPSSLTPSSPIRPSRFPWPHSPGQGILPPSRRAVCASPGRRWPTPRPAPVRESPVRSPLQRSRSRLHRDCGGAVGLAAVDCPDCACRHYAARSTARAAPRVLHAAASVSTRPVSARLASVSVGDRGCRPAGAISSRCRPICPGLWASGPAPWTAAPGWRGPDPGLACACPGRYRAGAAGCRSRSCRSAPDRGPGLRPGRTCRSSLR